MANMKMVSADGIGRLRTRVHPGSLGKVRLAGPFSFSIGASVIMVFLLSTFVVGAPFGSLPATGHTAAAVPSNPTTLTNVRSGFWSDPKTWGGALPSAGSNIMINGGTTVTYDLASSPDYALITVLGSLQFSRVKSTSISFQNMTVMMSGFLEVGTSSDPIPPNVNAVLRLNAVKEGSAGIMVMNMGMLEIHGTPVGKTFTKLAASVQSGSNTLTVSDNLGWHVGDHIVITSTSLFPSETEENYIASLSGNRVTLAKPLNYSHDGVAPAQGEVADLTRNVVVTSLDTSLHGMGVMFMYGAMGGISYAEFSHLGGQGILGHYPIHFHHVQNSMRGAVVEGVSVWDSHNRFITIHNTDSITVKNSVGYGGIGHGFFLEDGTEENNTLLSNIAILTLPGSIRPDDGSAAGFWVQNPRNNLTGNIAVSASGSGFDFSLPDRAPEVIPFNLGNFQASLNQATSPTILSITAFRNNEAHSNAGDGLHLYRLDVDNASHLNLFSNLKMWRNDGLGIELTASPSLVASSLLFGNQFGNMQVDTYNMTIKDTKFLGELPGISTLMNATNPYNARYMVAPLGVIFMGSNLTIQDSTFRGHATQSLIASADVINQQGGWSSFTIFLSNSYLLSSHPIIFGYPLNGESFIKVIKMNHNPALNFTLYRYDTNHGQSCKVNMDYMALQCPG